MSSLSRCFRDRNAIATGCALGLSALFVTAAVCGCSLQQSPESQVQSTQTQSQMVIEPKVVEAPAHPLPFKGRLVDGDPSDLPHAVAMSLSSNSPVTFTYREELTHDDYHVPLYISALDP